MNEKIVDIDATQYKDLEQSFSEKNIINNVYGKEYIITASDAQTLNAVSGQNPNITESLPVTYIGHNVDVDIITFRFRKFYLRTEHGYYEGKYSFVTDSVISNPNELSISVNVTYDKYEKNVESYDNLFINKNNYNVRGLVFEGIDNASYKVNKEPQVQENGVPYKTAYLDYPNEGNLDGLVIPPENRSYTKINAKKNADETYTINVEFRLLVWCGRNYQLVKAFSRVQERNDLYKATKVEISITGNTIETQSIDFNYTSDITDYPSTKTYELETNELLQTDETQGETERTSYLLAQETFRAFDKDRPIISFTLLDNKTYNFGGVERYLMAEDLIKIKDENRKYIGIVDNDSGQEMAATFKIIKVENIWDGSFYKRIVCKSVDMV